MSKVISLEEFRNEEIRRVENKAFEKFKVTKTEEDIYLYHEHIFKTGTSDLENFSERTNIYSVENFFDEETVEVINEIVVDDNQRIGIIEEDSDEDMNKFSIINVTSDKRFFISTTLPDEVEAREIFTALIAMAIRYINVEVRYLIQLNFKELKEMIK